MIVAGYCFILLPRFIHPSFSRVCCLTIGRAGPQLSHSACATGAASHSPPSCCVLLVLACHARMHARMAVGRSAHIHTWPAHACMHVAGRWRLRRHSSARCTSCGTASSPTTTRWVLGSSTDAQRRHACTHARMHAAEAFSSRAQGHGIPACMLGHGPSTRSANACMRVQHMALQPCGMRVPHPPLHAGQQG